MSLSCVSGMSRLGACVGSPRVATNRAIAVRVVISRKERVTAPKKSCRRGVTLRATATAGSPVATSTDTRVSSDFADLWRWLERNGVDTSKATPKLMDDGDGGRQWGLAATKDLGSGEAVLQVPETLWMTKATAIASPVGALLEEQPAWVLVASQLLYEKSLGAESKFAEYVRCLPTTLTAPLFWTAEELSLIQGSQLFQNAAGYDMYVRSTYQTLKDTVFDANEKIFPDSNFSEAQFLWAFGTLRARCLPPVDVGDEIALVPGLDLVNHSGLVNAVWTRKGGGLGSVFGGKGAGNSMLFRADSKTVSGTECFVNYGPAKVDSQFLLDFGFCDSFCQRPGYVLGPIEIPDTDVNQFDKKDILDVAGFKQAPSFTLRAFEGARLRVSQIKSLPVLPHAGDCSDRWPVTVFHTSSNTCDILVPEGRIASAVCPPVITHRLHITKH